MAAAAARSCRRNVKRNETSATRTNASMKKDRTIHSEPDSTANSRAATAAAQSAHQARLRLVLPLRRQLHCYHDHHPRLFLSYHHHSCAPPPRLRQQQPTGPALPYDTTTTARHITVTPTAAASTAASTASLLPPRPLLPTTPAASTTTTTPVFDRFRPLVLRSKHRCC